VRSRTLVAACTALLLFACGGEPRADRTGGRTAGRTADAPVRVGAASDLTAAFEELGRAFEAETGRAVTFSFGSSGLLAQQIRHGAPFDLFAAANVMFVNEVVAAGACDAATVAPYALGRIAIWTRAGGATPPASLAELAEARFTRIAIANPEHAPYGRAAREALEAVGAWAAVEPRLVLGENVRQTLQFAETGNVEAAIVALALVIRDRVNPWLLVEESLHQPLEQALVVCTGGAGRAGGEAFAAFVASPRGRAVMRSYGFGLPGEDEAGR
jgi:molybdate transport system substrate-binding protein